MKLHVILLQTHNQNECERLEGILEGVRSKLQDFKLIPEFEVENEGDEGNGNVQLFRKIVNKKYLHYD